MKQRVGPYASGAVPRPRVTSLLSGVWQCPTAWIVAGGGYGKTTALWEVASLGDCRWVRLRAADADPDALAARIAGALGAAWPTDRSALAAATGADDRLGLAERHAAMLCEQGEREQDDVLLVLDDVESAIGTSGGAAGDEAVARLLRVLCLEAPPQLHIVLSGRQLPGLGLGAAQGRGEVLQVGAPDLAFTLEETAFLLDVRLGAPAGRLAEECHSLTGGWLAALQLVVDQLRRIDPGEHRSALDRIRGHRGHLWQDFAAELLSHEPARTAGILNVAWAAGAVGSELLDAFGIPSAGPDLEHLRQRGLLVDAADPSEYALSPVLEDVVADRLDPDEARALRGRASLWFEENLRFEDALECRVGGPVPEVRSLVDRCGHTVVRRGGAPRVAGILRQVGTGDDPRLDTIYAEALQAIGEWDAAIELFGRLERRAGPDGLPAAAAWRFGVLLYLRGQTADAVKTLTAADRPDGTGADDAMVSAWLSTASWSRGDIGRAGELAETALRQAEVSGDACALAAGHVAAALVAASRGEREHNERSYRMALAAATAGGDRAQLARIHANLSSRALEEGDYRAAVAEAEAALNPGAGHRFFSALAFCNKAEAHLRLGELDDARGAIDDAIDAYSTLGSMHVCIPHVLSGELYRQRGDLTRARNAFERARVIADQSDDAHTLVAALCGLARTLGPDDHALARAAGQEAVSKASSLELPAALCSLAEVELWAGSRGEAERLASQAEIEARRTGDRAALAEALELRSAASDPPDAAHMAAALLLWEEMGNPIAAARARMVIGALRDEPDLVDEARADLAARNVSARTGIAGLLAARRAREVSITTLGRFSVVRNGETVPLGAWQSRKARDLLKLLVSRRGHPITRDAAVEILWPEPEGGRLGNRLSVALSIVRKILDPDRIYPPDHYVLADAQAIAVRLEHMSVDVVTFLELAAAATIRRGGGAGRAPDIEARLRKAYALYAGDFLEEDLYEDWAVDCREEARSAAQQVLRNLARIAAERGDDEAVSQYLSQLLERDPFDEDAWLGLVGAQIRLRRHGEARRRYAMYARRMAELEVAPVPLAEAVNRRP